MIKKGTQITRNKQNVDLTVSLDNKRFLHEKLVGAGLAHYMPDTYYPSGNSWSAEESGLFCFAIFELSDLMCSESVIGRRASFRSRQEPPKTRCCQFSLQGGCFQEQSASVGDSKATPLTLAVHRAHECSRRQATAQTPPLVQNSNETWARTGFPFTN